MYLTSPFAFRLNLRAELGVGFTYGRRRGTASPGSCRPGSGSKFEQAGSYLGWRVGIRKDGTWLFFVAGD
jgi:hypothetical protein